MDKLALTLGWPGDTRQGKLLFLILASLLRGHRPQQHWGPEEVSPPIVPFLFTVAISAFRQSLSPW